MGGDNRDGNDDKVWMIAVMVGGEMPQQPGGSLSNQGGLQQSVLPAVAAQAVGPRRLPELEPQQRPRPVFQGRPAAHREIPSH